MEWIIEVVELSKTLNDEFNRGPIVNDKGMRSVTEKVVARFNGMRVYVFSREHPPPHFRVEYAGEIADFTIKDCSKISGKLQRWERTIRDWHGKNKCKLIEAWNDMRPSDCPVGGYSE